MDKMHPFNDRIAFEQEVKRVARTRPDHSTIIPDAGNDIQNVRTAAVREGDHWVLDGLKAFITLGGDADVLVTLAQTDRRKGRGGMQFFAVDRASPGVVATQIETWVNRPAPTYRVALNGVRVPESRRIAGSSSVRPQPPPTCSAVCVTRTTAWVANSFAAETSRIRSFSGAPLSQRAAAW